ncbi:PLDc_N domain-containing protein [Bacillus sp. WMMC1349]|uniref:PLDc N-terminal domain-containing protein n=1 Tax=Bacillus sp. WMMC1349 TaxID=2736254 RepID=UPI00155368BD|nr:PLD nuclease N-terminal domain-containing protein [Bacillus sp. WMMC1349]NPC94604.1 PLDc_N domain-containing protein [Bacillus sp. WMMC1349]
MAGSEIPWEMITPFILLYLILVVSALLNCVKEKETNGPKWLWFLIIVGISMIGPILYFIVFRQKTPSSVV